MRNLAAIVAAALIIGVVSLALAPWVDSGDPFQIAGREITLTPSGAAIFVFAIFLSHLIGGAISRWIEPTGKAVNFLIIFEIMSRVIKYIGKLTIAPREIPDGMDLATVSFKSAWPYLIVPSWYIPIYGVLAVLGLLVGSSLTRFLRAKAGHAR